MASSAETLLEGRRRTTDEAGTKVAELFQRHGRMVLGLCRLLLRDASEAEDAAQQTFLSAYRSLLGGTEPRQPAAWLATIARNECWARTRDRMREPLAEPDPEGPSDAPDPLDATIRRADLAALWSAIDNLPPQQRDALLMREFSGLSYEELAETLDVTQPAVESLLFRARRELRVRLRPVLAPAFIAPVGILREALLRLLGDSTAVGAAAKVAAAPAAAKLAAGTAAVGLVAGGVVAVDPQLVSSLRQQPASALGVQAPVPVAAPKKAESRPPTSKPKLKPKPAVPARSASVVPAKTHRAATRSRPRPSRPAHAVVVSAASKPRPAATVTRHRLRSTVQPVEAVQRVPHVQRVQHARPAQHVQSVRAGPRSAPSSKPERSHVRQARAIAPKAARPKQLRVRARPAAPKVRPKPKPKARPKATPAPAAPAATASPADLSQPSQPSPAPPRNGRLPGSPQRLPPDRRLPPQPTPPPPPPATQPAVSPGNDDGVHPSQPSPSPAQPPSTPPPGNSGPAPGGAGSVNVGSGPINAAPLLGPGNGAPVQGGSPPGTGSAPPPPGGNA